MDERIIKYFDGRLDKTERLELLKQLETDELLKKDFINYRNLQGLISLASSPMDEGEGMESYTNFIGEYKSKTRRKLFFNIAKYAAAVAILISATWYLSSSYTSNRLDTLYSESLNTIEVPAGQRVSVTLNDGTTVWLNAKSKLTYPSLFSGDTRKVELVGEGYFVVARNEEKPFIVNASSIDVKVLGTSFNVNNYAETNFVSISLLEGLVEVYDRNNTSEKILLHPNQCATYVDGKITLSDFMGEDDFLWKQGVYSFENVPMADIVQKLELYYDTKIIVQNPDITKHMYTGKFRQRDGVMEILRIIQKIHKFNIEKDEKNNIIILK